MTLSQEQAADYKKKMEYLRADMELVSRKLQAEIKELQNRIMQELQPKALEAIKEFTSCVINLFFFLSVLINFSLFLL